MWVLEFTKQSDAINRSVAEAKAQLGDWVTTERYWSVEKLGAKWYLVVDESTQGAKQLSDDTKFDVQADTSVTYFAPLTPRQIRLVLNQAGLRQAVEDAIAQADQTIKDYWEFSLSYEYDNPVLQALSNKLGLTKAQVDEMFLIGAKL